ncbi:ferritin-like domain-containing protein [Amycolatopsis sp. H20-H5]|uniref:ferritin-like domain-containing protein n=1 Tax=Amycolatopsis sp. H20-H5 TaxID=3046309 RepID=UPI002DBCD53E|nr:ferritin-like domain-containing protein [Amycolatopsis sp. H20-H5]MEC3973939.1 ferritin-like domain-containing protein [Amycolatopsis sp. H20-H5]
MFGKPFVRELISRSAENDSDRRRFLKSAGAVGLGVVGAGYLGGVGSSAMAAGKVATAAADGPSDGAVLNFALNLEYLEAEFYSYAVNGCGLDDKLTTGTGTRGGVTGGRRVPFRSRALRQFAQEIAGDELAHVKFLRTALGASAVSRPQIDIKNSFTAAARAAGLIKANQTFDPYANENNFLLAAFIFEDVGVTAYKGAAPLISNKTYLEAAAGILAVEAYHAGLIRSQLFERDLADASVKISNARDSLDGPTDDDQGAVLNGRANIQPTDANGIAFSRTADRVLNVVYLNPASVKSGGFFPHGVNGDINTSGGA